MSDKHLHSPDMFAVDEREQAEVDHVPRGTVVIAH